MTDRLDTVGYWTEIKLQILQEYANAYAQVLINQASIKHVAYIDGFAGAGTHISKGTGERIEGSPARALAIQPPFSHYHFVEMDAARAQRLRDIGSPKDVTVYHGDCNEVLLKKVFPQCRYEDFRRALCLLDPYALNPNWEVIATAGKMRSIEIFLNFMIMDANMNVLWNNPDSVVPEQAARMTKFWGDDSWRESAYKTEEGLFGPMQERRRMRQSWQPTGSACGKWRALSMCRNRCQCAIVAALWCITSFLHRRIPLATRLRNTSLRNIVIEWDSE